MYDGAFPIELFVKLEYLELETYSEPCQISIMENLFRTMCNSSIFKSLAY